MIIDGKEMAFEMEGRTFHCALDVSMSFIGGKWKSVLLWYMRAEPKRFSELNRLVPGITEKMLSLQLKELEADGIIRREVFAEVPPRVEYSFTEFGRTMIPMLEAIANWGRQLAQQRGKMVEAPGRNKGKLEKTK
ncbi:MAG: winged helix-turn-helix transcriptional regulator [Lewinellaceae bacterium]|nr:winged helix-turn-helix transcriptional regulator [Lewinellaceae bacterium]